MVDKRQMNAGGEHCMFLHHILLPRQYAFAQQYPDLGQERQVHQFLDAQASLPIARVDHEQRNKSWEDFQDS